MPRCRSETPQESKRVLGSRRSLGMRAPGLSTVGGRCVTVRHRQQGWDTVACGDITATVLDRAPVIGALALASSLESTEGMK